MDPESKKLLENILKLVEDNNKILKGIRRRQMWSSVLKFFYWLVIIGIALGSFYFIQPYIANLQKFMKDSGATIDQFKNLVPKDLPKNLQNLPR